MSIALKIIPDMTSPKYTLEKSILTIPVSYSYEDRDGLFIHNISGGLQIIGKPHPENNVVTYFIGESCSIDQLSSFISNIGKGLNSNITFSEVEDNINMIEYDPNEETWKHITGSRMGTFGSTIILRATPETVKSFKKTFEEFRRFAFMMIEGHRRISDDSLDMF